MFKSIIIVFISLIFAAIGQVVLKYGMNNVGSIDTFSLQGIAPFIVKTAKNPLIWFGCFLYGMAALAWLIVLSRESLSFVYPFAGLTFVIVLFLSSAILKEQVSLWRWLGTSVIIIGLLITVRS
ncbi:MAG: multidrug resistance protein [Actinobacteria bacterium]|nr:MAG: multidrug resistance protein [Actinomycetota bacterium]